MSVAREGKDIWNTHAARFWLQRTNNFFGLAPACVHDAGAVREGRRWRLVLADGARIPVSARFAGAARSRGWLRIRA